MAKKKSTFHVYLNDTAYFDPQSTLDLEEVSKQVTIDSSFHDSDIYLGTVKFTKGL